MISTNPNLKIDEFKKLIIDNITVFDPLKKTNNYIDYTLKLMWLEYSSKNLTNYNKEKAFLEIIENTN